MTRDKSVHLDLCIGLSEKQVNTCDFLKMIQTIVVVFLAYVKHLSSGSKMSPKFRFRWFQISTLVKVSLTSPSGPIIKASVLS